MKTIILIACGKEKRKEASKAKDLYQGSYFKKIWSMLIYYQKNIKLIFIFYLLNTVFWIWIKLLILIILH